jgi:signal transduction histidine kinase
MQTESPAVMRAARVTAAATIAFSVALLVVIASFDRKFAATGRDDLQVSGTDLVWITAWLASAGVGAILLVRRPSHPVGWLFAALSATIAIIGASDAYASYGLLVDPGSLPGAASVAVIFSSLFVIVFVLLALVCSLTPDGRYLSNPWRRASHVMVAASGLWFGLRLISSQSMDAPFAAVENPWAVASPVLTTVRTVASTVSNALVVAAAVSLVVRMRRADGEARRQLRWITIAAVPVAALLVIAFVAVYTGHEALVNAAAAGIVVLIPLGAGLAVTRYHLYDVDRILSRAVTYLIVTALVIGTYVAVVFVVARVIGQAAGRSPTAITVATLVAVAVARPVYVAVRDLVDRRFQRRRFDALRQVRAFIADPGPNPKVETVLQQALADSELRVAYWDTERARWVTEDGRAAEVGPDAFVVDRGGRSVAAVTTRCDDSAMARAVLDEAAPELDNAGLRAAVAVQLEQVRASRERIAEAQIDERRRIERDLHDGAQQRLLGTAAQMQAALLNGDPERLRAALELGVCESRHAVAELRALANGLHPAVLDDGGLPTALEDLSSRLPVSVAVSDPGQRYPPLQEATLWFVACEAVANATKHAPSSRVAIRLDDLGDELRLVVEDDGCGGADPGGPGLRGLADRVEAAGGRLTIVSDPSAGTRVEAVVPCGL